MKAIVTVVFEATIQPETDEEIDIVCRTLASHGKTGVGKERNPHVRDIHVSYTREMKIREQFADIK